MYKIAIISSLLFWSIFLGAQPNNSYINNVVMPSPAAASLGKYGDIPVSYYTGVPNIGIPIHTLSEGPLSLPVSLSYHASGVKVGETASWVGMNWNLNAGGMITRTVQGKIDEEATEGWLYTPAIPTPPTPTGIPRVWDGDYCGFYDHVFSGGSLLGLDSEPDLFTFNFPGGSGKFYFKKDKSVVLVPKQDIKIVPQFTANSTDLKKFLIITPDGTRYLFGDIGVGSPAIETTQGDGGGMPVVASSWYLKKIETADQQFSISLTYTDEASQTDYRPNVAVCSQPAPGSEASQASGPTIVKGFRLSSITTSTETMTFNAGNTREDVSVYSTPPYNSGSYLPKTLGNIVVSTGTGTSALSKKFTFTYTYWTDNSSDQIVTGPAKANKRLKLQSVQETSGDGTTIVNPAYTFEYFAKTGNPDFMPHRLSRSIDHWGFFNEKDNGPWASTLLNIPAGVSGTCYSGDCASSMTIPLGGSTSTVNRETEEAPMKYGTLKKVNYPTGGYTEFDFEANDYFPNMSEVQTVQSVYINASGYQCTTPTTYYTSPSNNSVTFNDLSNVTYSWQMTGNTNCACGGGQSSFQIKVYTASNYSLYAQSAIINSNCAMVSASNNIAGFFSPALQTGVAYRFELVSVNSSVTFAINSQVVTTLNKKKVGGLRIQQITTYDGSSTANNIIKTYEYLDPSINVRSSGILYNKPKYVHTYSWYPCRTPVNCGSVCPPITCPQYELSSGGCMVGLYDNSIVPLGSFEGYHIGYAYVKEKFNNNGYKTYLYQTEPVAVGSDGYPLELHPAPPAPARVKAGNLLTANTYNNSDNLIASETYTPKNDAYTESTDVMYKKLVDGCGSFLTVYKIRTGAYRVETMQNVLDGVASSVTYTYDPGNNYLFPISQSTTNSDGKVHLTEYKYIYDYTANTAIRDTLKARYMISTPWKTIAKVDNVEVGGTEQEYAWYSFASGAYQPNSTGAFPRLYKYYNFEKTWDSGTLTGPGKTLRGTVDSYNAKGQPTSFTTPNWPAETYTWSTNGLILTKSYNGYTTEYTYHDGTRLVSKIKQPDGQEAWFDYDKLMRTQKAWARPATANSKTTAKVTTEYDYRYRAQSTPTNTLGENYVKTITTYATAPTGGGTSGLTTQEVFQYLDGLGRPYQTVNRKQSPGQKDVVLATEYDKWGRTIKSYNPIESTLNTGAKLSSIAASTPYTLTEYYSDPLSRPWKVTPPSWYASTYTYEANTGSDVYNNVSGANYAANSLSKTTVKDPDNKVVVTFKDKKGRTVLVRRTDTNNTTPANTYNIYDDKDRLTLVIPPGSTYSTSSLNFAYTYDAADLMLTKKVPDAAIVTMRYNNRDQLVLEQDGNLSTATKWRCTQYDDFGRVIKTGLLNDSGVPAAPIPNTLAPGEVYTENQYGTTGIEKGKIKKSRVKVFDTNGTWLETKFSYDIYGRVSGTTGNNYLMATDTLSETMTYIYDFADNILKDTRVSKKNATASSNITINQKHNYDHWARNTLNTHQIGTGTEMTVSQLNYDWKNQLIEKNLGKVTATNYLQSLDFRYNNQGWLTTINTATLGGSNTSIATCPTAPTMPNPGTANATADNNDLFYLELKYDTLQSGISGTAVKNGNIAQVLWRVRGRERQSYSLTYDYLDRMTGSTYNNLSDAGSTNNAGAWNENLTYDIRGNINTLTRTGKYKSSASPNCWTDGQIDNLAYTYTSNTNKLQKVADTAPTASKAQGWNNVTNAASTAQYNYDANGNMKSDPYKGFAITYNFLNLPTRMQLGNDFTGTKTIDVLYDASGRKLRKTVTDGTTLQYSQDYVGGIEYRTTSSVTLSLESIYHPEGRVFNTNTGTTSANALRYEYSIKDHLGNTRLNFTDKNGDGKVAVTTTTTNEILSESHYYPFGMAMSGPWMDDASARDNQYKYNGKELNEDFGLGWYDYGARWYDASLGRFPNLDPLADTFNYVTPYNYAENSPVTYIDLWGMQQYKPKMGNNPLRNAYEGFKTIAYELGSTMAKVGRALYNALPDEGSSASQVGNNSEDYEHSGTGIEMLSGTKFSGNGTLSLPTAENGADVLIGTDELLVPSGGGSGGLKTLAPELGAGIDFLIEAGSKLKDAETVSGFVLDKALEDKYRSLQPGDTVIFRDMNGNSYEMIKNPKDQNGVQAGTIIPIKNDQ